MVIYHEARREDVPTILRSGLRRTSKGPRSNDPDIHKTNAFLDAHRPKRLQDADVWRTKCLYGFVGGNDWVIELEDGRKNPLKTHLARTTQAVFRVTPAVHFCYASDLDLYDAVYKLQKTQPSASALVQAANRYWNAIIPLRDFNPHMMQRPEILITCDLLPASISLIAS